MVVEQPAAVAIVVVLLELQLTRGDGRDERVHVDLSVRMVQRDTHFDAAVLEWEYVLHIVARTELRVAMRPYFEQQLDMRQRQRAERGRRVLREYHDLARAEARPRRDDRLRWIVRQRRQRGKQIFEHRHVPRALWHLGRMLGIRRGRERVVFRRRQERAVLAMTRVHHPFAAQRVPAKMGIRCGSRRVGARRRERCRQRHARIEQQCPSIRLGEAKDIH